MCAEPQPPANSTDDSPQVPNAAPRPDTIPHWDTCTRVEMCCEVKRFARKETGQNAWPSIMDEFNANNAPAGLSHAIAPVALRCLSSPLQSTVPLSILGNLGLSLVCLSSVLGKENKCGSQRPLKGIDLAVMKEYILEAGVSYDALRSEDTRS